MIRVLRIAVFGISRSGKDYTIEGAVKLLSERRRKFSHVSLIKEVYALLDGRKLSQMGDNEKRALMEEARVNIDSKSAMSNLIVDEHYSFPHTYGGKVIHNGYVDEKIPFREIYDDELDLLYEVVFDEAELEKYDKVFFLDIEPAIVLDRFRKSEGCKCNNDITLRDVRSWILFEKYNLMSLCSKHRIPFNCLKGSDMTSEQLVDRI